MLLDLEKLIIVCDNYKADFAFGGEYRIGGKVFVELETSLPFSVFHYYFYNVERKQGTLVPEFAPEQRRRVLLVRVE